jgi:para-nitrobenzyl esterase
VVSAHNGVPIFDTQPVVTAYPEEPSRVTWQSHTFPVLG